MITAAVARDACALLEVDEHGFDEVDRKLLLTIIDKFGGGPVGVGALAAAISEETDAIEDIYEPFLLQIGFIDRTRAGAWPPGAPTNTSSAPCPRAAPARRSCFSAASAPAADLPWIADFDYELPPEAIAQEADRAARRARLLRLPAGTRARPPITSSATCRGCCARATSSS